VHAGYRVVRVAVAFVLLALSVGWLLLRRRSAGSGRPRLTVVPPPSGHAFAGTDLPREPAEPIAPVEPRAPEPTLAAGRPVHDIGDTLVEAPAEASPVAAPEPGPAEPTGALDPDDDLRRIRGIGPAIETALRGVGIRTYRQLAALDGPERERLQEALRDFRQRIEREDWAGQARALHREKYGSEPTG
jgi:predicted flap endonuclease-1-like 5' DNA nuclease